YISGIHHVESRNIQSCALMKLYFHPGTDMAQAMAETIAYVNRSRSFMPPGTVPPDVVRFDTGSVPVGYLVMTSPSRSIGEIQDLALFRVRPIFASLPGVSAPPPFGGNQRTLVVQVDPDRLRSYRLSPDDIVAALKSGNSISPSGNARIKDQMPIVPVNSMVRVLKDLGSIPLRLGENVYLRDVADISDSTDIPMGHTLVNGKKAIFMLVTKRADASTLSVVNSVKSQLPAMRAVLPDDIDVSFEFDQSPYVMRSIEGVCREGALGALLTGVMVLLFLRDWRTVVVVVLNIPFALLAAICGLWLFGQTINLMTLGGLALAVGILVDVSTVEVENIHTHLHRAPSVARAARQSNSETAVPRLLAMLCVLAVFLPSFLMQGAAREMFVPLSLAVGFAMIAAYYLSSTFVPIMAVWLLKPQPHGSPAKPGADHAMIAGQGDLRQPDAPARPRSTALAGASGWCRRMQPFSALLSFERFRGWYAGGLKAVMPWRWLLIGGYLAGSAAVIAIVGPRLGLEIFPKVNAGEFQLRLRAPDGTRIEITAELVQEALRLIRAKTQEPGHRQASAPATGEKTKADGAANGQVQISVAYCGLHPTSYTINNMYLWMRGPEEAVLRVALKDGSEIELAEFQETLREYLPPRLRKWLAARLRREGVAEGQIAARLRGLRLSFEPADIVNQVMSFGSPTPIEVSVSGPDFADNLAHARKIFEQMSQIPSLRDVQFGQSLDYPAVAVNIDREKAGLSGVTAADVARSLVSATSSSRFVEPIFWADPATGIGYYTQVEIPPYRMDSAEQIGMTPLQLPGREQLLVRDVAELHAGSMPGQYDRYNMRRLVAISANIEGEDLGRVGRRLDRALEAAGAPPRGVEVDIRGQVVPMRQMFRGLATGLALAMLVILLLLTAYFQSFRLAVVSASTLPAVVTGVVCALALTGDTLNIQSFMGTIMAVGVATANAILLLTFAERSRQDGMSAAEAAIDGAQSRLRPVLMTSFAMLAGMVPMALALAEGEEQSAPLGRAVIGGLVAATLATLVVLPSVFAVLQRRASTASPSLDPDDAASRYFDRAGGASCL
ncbi:MAG TPA: efflux RND transporter permease subunit, partial [Pirellulales bacterium]